MLAKNKEYDPNYDLYALNNQGSENRHFAATFDKLGFPYDDEFLNIAMMGGA